MNRFDERPAAREPLRLPLLQSADPKRPVIWSEGRPVSARELLDGAAAVARQPQSGQQSLNLCERRDAFIVSFCGALLRGHTNILPPSRAQAVLEEVAAARPGCYRSDDSAVHQAWEEIRGATSTAKDPSRCEIEIPADHVATIAFTSGSTGIPQGHPKSWRSFTRSSQLNAQCIRESLAESGHTARPWIVATVPAQHMYGLETSVLLPLLGDMAVYAGRPLFPADIAAALAEIPHPRVLVTTPFHLRAIATSGQAFPATELVVSATAPLDAALARAIEHLLGTTVLEMFGSTETCVIATRHTARDETWRLYPEVTLDPYEAGTRVQAPWFAAAVSLQDILEPQPARGFTVRGRNADMVEVAGKRASLADLTQRLLNLPGVRDAVVFQPDAASVGTVRRVAALAVAPGLTAEALCERLARSVDAAFIPRPLILVTALPRNEVGKLPRERLLAALRGNASP